METARWNRIEEVLQAALDLEPAGRSAFLDEACGSDTALRREVDDLLRHEREASFLSEPAIAARPDELRTRQQISHYRIERHIASGGMGNVYEARDESLQRTVALKELSPELTADPERVRRFEQEAFTASRLNHPNIITIFEIVHEADAHFIVTERVEGITLRELLQSRRPSLAEALDITIQVAGAIKAAHTAWIIHRDIKPENIMVRADGLVKVLDFGIAKLSEGEARTPASARPRAGEAVNARADEMSPPLAANLTVPGAIIGTARYMSPEQGRGEPLDGRSDIYSLGLVLREMLDRPPRAVQPIVDRMLRPNRDERYSSAAELLDDLQRLRRRIENRSARTVVGVSVAVALVAIVVVGIAAALSIHETWDERILRDGHSAAARHAAFSPDGRLLLSCGEDGQVIVWDFERRERVATLHHRSHAIAWSGDGRSFATGGTDGRVVIWDTATRRPVSQLRHRNSAIGSVAFTPDGRILASDTQTIGLYDVHGGKRLRLWDCGLGYGNFLFLRGGQVLTSGFVLLDPRDGRMKPMSEYGGNWVALAPDGSYLASVDPLGKVQFSRFSGETPEVLARIHAHQDHGRSIAFSPDGRLLATAAEDIVLWDAATRTKIARLEFPSIVWSVVFSPDGRWLVSSHGDGSVLIWNVAERQRVANLNEHGGAVRSVAISRDGSRVFSAGEDRTVSIWNSESGLREVVLIGHENRVTAVASQGDLVTSADQSGNFIVWDVRNRKPKLTIAPPEEIAAYTVAISPDGRFIASSHGIYQQDGRQVATFADVGRWVFGGIYSASFFPDSTRLAAVTDLGMVIVWDAKRGRLAESHRLSRSPHVAVSVSADGRWLVTGDDEGIVRLWTASPLQPVAILGRHTARAKSVAFSPDGTLVASAGDDKTIALWDVKRRKLHARVGTHASPVYAVAFSPDGRRLVSGEHDHTVRVYTLRRTLWGFRLD